MVDASPISTFKALLDSQKDCQQEWLHLADIITFACEDLRGTEPLKFNVLGFVHGHGLIGGLSLK